MKTKIFLLSLLTGAGLALLPGCVTNKSATGQTVSITFLGNTIFPTNAYSVASSVAFDAASVAIRSNAANSNYLAAAYQVLNAALASPNFDPNALQAALVQVQLGSPVADTAIVAVVDASFAIFAGLDAQAAQASPFLLPIFQGLRDGIGESLGIVPTAKQTHQPANAPVAAALPFLFFRRKRGGIPLFAVCLLTGCSLSSAYPKTKITGTLGGHPFTLQAPKDYDINGLEASVDTNGAIHLHIDSLKANLSVTNIAAVGSAESQIVTATGAVAHQAVQDAIAGAVQLGAKVVAP